MENFSGHVENLSAYEIDPTEFNPCTTVTLWPRVTVTQMIRQMTGDSKSILCRCDDGAYYIVKFLESPIGPNHLANEALGSRLADVLRVETPHPTFVFVPDFLLKSAPTRWFEHFANHKAPAEDYYYGSQYMGDPSKMETWDFLPRRAHFQIVNTTDFLKMLVLDIWTNNQDFRQAVFTRPTRGRGYLATFIDHGHMFGGPHCIIDDKLTLGSYYYKAIYRGLWCEKRIGLCIDKLNEHAHEVIQRHFDEVPSSWYDNRHRQATEQILHRLWSLDRLLNVCRDRLIL